MTHQQSIHDVYPQLNQSVGWGVKAIAIAGIVLRGWLAVVLFPITGDPVYSNCYRGMLIANGNLDGLLLMWNPPGYPLLLGSLSWATGSLLRPYECGVLISLAAFGGLVLVVDKLVAHRVRWPVSRLFIASFLAFYEGLFLWATTALTEPAYCLLLYGAILLADCRTISGWRALIIGATAGLAMTFRQEAIAPFIGLLILLTWRSVREAKNNGPWANSLLNKSLFRSGPLVFHGKIEGCSGENRLIQQAAKLTVPVGMVLGAMIVDGWVVFHLNWLMMAVEGYRPGFTIPPRQGLLGNGLRLIECLYYAWVVWLPVVLLLPYWLLLGIGLLSPPKGRKIASLTALLLAVVLPAMAAVCTSTMHKRIGSFFLPAAAIWCGLGLEQIIVSWRIRTVRWGPNALVASAIVFTVLQATRICYSMRKTPPDTDPISYVAAGLLLQQSSQAGKVWAFGSEPEIYYFWGKPIVYPYFQVPEGYLPIYLSAEGNPEQFIRNLRSNNFSYLIFSIAETPANSQIDSRERQHHDWLGGTPFRRDLSTIVRFYSKYNIDLLGTRFANGGQTRVYLFHILPNAVE